MASDWPRGSALRFHPALRTARVPRLHLFQCAPCTTAPSSTRLPMHAPRPTSCPSRLPAAWHPTASAPRTLTWPSSAARWASSRPAAPPARGQQRRRQRAVVTVVPQAEATAAGPTQRHGKRSTEASAGRWLRQGTRGGSRSRLRLRLRLAGKPLGATARRQPAPARRCAALTAAATEALRRSRPVLPTGTMRQPTRWELLAGGPGGVWPCPAEAEAPGGFTHGSDCCVHAACHGLAHRAASMRAIGALRPVHQ